MFKCLFISANPVHVWYTDKISTSSSAIAHTLTQIDVDTFASTISHRLGKIYNMCFYYYATVKHCKTLFGTSTEAYITKMDCQFSVI